MLETHRVDRSVLEHTSGALELSVVVPIFNEAENIARLYHRISDVLADAEPPYKDSYEIVLVDDGSKDQSFEICALLQKSDPRVVVVQLRRNFGKTAALHAGFQCSSGRRIVTIDADMQEDPRDMFSLLNGLDQGYDLVSAWRKERNDPLSKTIPSKIFNFVVSSITGVPLHDLNCGFKAYNREVVENIRFYSDQHRFIPVIASRWGFRVGEVIVDHYPRQYGRSKFGLRRLVHGVLDFVQVLFIVTYMWQPFRLFGSVGFFLFTAGFFICCYLVFLWFLGDRPIGDRPLLILGVLLILSGLQFISTGFIGEMMRRGGFDPGEDYSVRRVLRQNVDEGGL